MSYMLPPVTYYGDACQCIACCGAVYGQYHFTPTPQPWECPRCHKMHGPASLTCDCPPGDRQGASIATLDFTEDRTARVLEANGIHTVGALSKLNDLECLRLINLGKKSLNDIKQALAKVGLHLGMK